MAVKTFTDSTALPASDINTFLANSGLVYVKQVAVGSGVASVDVTSCFNATYDNYLISFAGIQLATAGASIEAKLLVGTTPTTSGFYGTEFYVAVGGTAWSAQLATAAGGNGAYAYISACNDASEWNALVNIQSPYKTQHTRWQYQVCDSSYFRNGYVIHQANTSYDGISFRPTGSTLTGGTITVYGYRLG